MSKNYKYNFIIFLKKREEAPVKIIFHPRILMFSPVQHINVYNNTITKNKERQAQDYQTHESKRTCTTNMILSSFSRYENKYLITESQYERIKPVILDQMIPDIYCPDGKSYPLANIYYDTPEDNIIRYSLMKPVYKEKLRLRSYGTPRYGSDTVFLELKKKMNGLVLKRRATLTLDQAMDFLEMGKFPQNLSYIDDQVLKEIDYFISLYNLTAKVYISYDREAYFLENDLDFRVTFDSNILTRRCDLYLEDGSYGSPLMEDHYRLMEIKVLTNFPSWLANILSETNTYPVSFSKYGLEYSKYIKNARSNNND